MSTRRARRSRRSRTRALSKDRNFPRSSGMSSCSRPLSKILLAFSLAALSAISADAATYLPISDEQLARRAPVIVRARVVGQETRLTSEEGTDAVVTATRFEPLEVLKGSIMAGTFSIDLTGGAVGNLSSWVPGTPSFVAGGEVLLFLAPSPSDPGRFGLTEFALSEFDLIEDGAGRRFAVRAAFRPEEDDALSGRAGAAVARSQARRPLRDAESFLSGLRAAVSGQDFPPVVYAVPGQVRSPESAAPAWVNIGGTEGSNRLYRWFWDTGRSPAARVLASGTQSGLTDGSDGRSFVENAALEWVGVSVENVIYSP